MEFKGIIFPCSSTVALEILESLNNIKNFSLIGVNSHENYEYKILFDKTYNECPYYDNEEECINYLLKICNLEKCNFIIPTMDNTHFILSKNKYKFDINNIKIISSSFSINELCLSKEKTYKFFNKIINCPRMYDFSNIKNIDFPVFLKP